MNRTKSIRNNTVDKTKKKQLANWVIQEIENRRYTQKQMDTIMFLTKKGKQKEVWRILLKGHKCPVNCYCDSICWNSNCQKETNTWQGKMNKAQRLLELAEKEGNEARELRIKETVHLLTQQFKQKQHE